MAETVATLRSFYLSALKPLEADAGITPTPPKGADTYAKLRTEYAARVAALKARAAPVVVAPPAPPPVVAPPPPAPSPPATAGVVANVKSGADLSAAVKAAKPGDALYLEGGDYLAWFGIYLQHFDVPILIASADPLRPAVIPKIDMSQAGGVIFRDLELRTNGPGYFTHNFADCHDITLQRLFVHGSLDGNPQNDAEGVAFKGCTNFSILDSTFTELVRAITCGASEDAKLRGTRNKNVTISRNRLHRLQVTGMMLGAVNGGEVSSNYITEFLARMTGDVASDHPDAIQFLSNTGALASISQDVVIRANLIDRAAGNVGMQGIFVTCEDGGLSPPTNMAAVDNLLIGTGYNGIAFNGALNCRIAGNEVYSRDADKLKSWITAQNTKGVIATNNTAIDISFKNAANNNTGVVETGSIINAPVTDPAKLAAIEAAWRAKHPEVPK